MELFDIAEDRQQYVDLLPVECHVDQDQFGQVWMDQLVDVFFLEVVFVDSPKFITRQNKRSQISQLLDYFKVLVPAVEQVLG